MPSPFFYVESVDFKTEIELKALRLLPESQQGSGR